MFVAGLPCSRRMLLRLRIWLPRTKSIIVLTRSRLNDNVFIQPPVNFGFGSPMIVRSDVVIAPSPLTSTSFASPGFHFVPDSGLTAVVYAAAVAESRSKPSVL